MSTGRWIDKEGNIDKEDKEDNGILVIKNNDILPFVATWMDLEIIMLSEMSDRER